MSQEREDSKVKATALENSEEIVETGEETKNTRVILFAELTVLFASLSIDFHRVAETLVEIQTKLHLPMNIFLGLLFSLISAVFEEKAILFIEKIETNEGLVKYILANLPALGMFLGAGACFIGQTYFLKGAGAKYGIISFGIWSAAVTTLLLFESRENIKSPLVIAGYLAALGILTGIQMYVSSSES